MKRFYDKVKVNATTGCHEWTAYKNEDGYGMFRMDGNTLRAHRLAWTLKHGEITNGLHCLHKCDNPSCVNPEHLFLGTHQDNMADKANKGRGNQPKGEGHHRTVITREQAIEVHRRIRAVERYSNGRVKIGELLRVAEETGVRLKVVRHISAGDTWKHLTAEEV